MRKIFPLLVIRIGNHVSPPVRAPSDKKNSKNVSFIEIPLW